MPRVKTYLSTGEAAALFDVDPETVLRWINIGEIPAIRTPGGHYRIHKNVFLSKIIRSEDEKQSELSYCWKFHSDSGKIAKECKQCIAYESRANRCYVLSKIETQIGHAKQFCSESCEDCTYFRNCHQFAN